MKFLLPTGPLREFLLSVTFSLIIVSASVYVMFLIAMPQAAVLRQAEQRGRLVCSHQSRVMSFIQIKRFDSDSFSVICADQNNIITEFQVVTHKQ